VSSSTEFSKENKPKSAVPKNYYFIESEIAPLILIWQEIHNRKKECEEKLKKDKEARFCNEESELTPQLRILVENNRQKIRAEFQKREKYDVCFQIAVEACIKALPRFSPEYGTAFNYLSLTAKKSIIYYLIKRAKKKHLSLDFEYIDDDNLQFKNLVRQEEKSLRNLEIENLTDSISNLIQDKSEHKSLEQANKELREYLFYSQGKYDKKDFFKWAKADGISSNLLRKFVKFLKEHKTELFKEVGVY
jgi:DNA-directed RNA polymerase specialized sigma subunit